MRRLTFRIVSVVSLLLCIGLCVLWWRSYRNGNSPSRADSFSITKTETLYWFISGPGKLTLCGQRGRHWDNPLHGHEAMGFHFGGKWGNDGSLLWNAVAPYWALVTITAVAPVVHVGAYVLRRRIIGSRGFAPVLEQKLDQALQAAAA